MTAQGSKSYYRGGHPSPNLYVASNRENPERHAESCPLCKRIWTNPQARGISHAHRFAANMEVLCLRLFPCSSRRRAWGFYILRYLHSKSQWLGGGANDGAIVVTQDTWKYDGQPRLAVRKALRRDAAVREATGIVCVEVKLSDALQAGWEIWRIDLTETTDKGVERLIESVQSVDNPASRFYAKEYLSGLQRMGSRYAIVVSLHAHGNIGEHSIETAKRAITEGQGIDIKDVPQSGSTPEFSNCLCSKASSALP